MSEAQGEYLERALAYLTGQADGRSLRPPQAVACPVGEADGEYLRGYLEGRRDGLRRGGMNTPPLS